MPISPTLGLDLPSFSEIKAEKELRFPQSGGLNQVIIYPDMASMQDAITARLPGSATEPSADPAASSLVMAGIRWLGNTLPEPPIEVMQPGEDDDESIDGHPLTKLLLRPNPYTSGATLWKAFAYSWIISGNVYLIKRRNQFGQVVQLWYEPHWSIRPRWQNDKKGVYLKASDSQSIPSVPRSDKTTEFINYYEVDRDGEQFRIEPNDVIHFRDGIDPYNTRLGLSGIATILREIFGDSAAAEYAGGLLAARGVPPFILSIDNAVANLSANDIPELKDRLMRAVRRGEPMVITNAKVEQMGLTAEEVDLRTSRYLSEERFSAVTGIPATVLNLGAGLEKSIYNNMQQAQESATNSYLVPLWWYRDEELTVQLLRDFDEDEDHYVESDTSEVGALQEDENELHTRIGQDYQNGIITRAEARVALNYESDAEGRDDVYLMKMGTETITLEQEEEERESPEPQLALAGQPQRKLLQGAPARIKQLYGSK